jgi:hypothetical protein
MFGNPSMEKKFEYRGDLGVTPLPEILATIGRYRVPGALSVGSGPRVRRIYLDGGAVVLATSEEPEVRLGTYLIRHGTLPEEAVHGAEERLEGDGVRLGQILLRLELVDQATLEAAVAEQVRAILWGAFEWDSGEVLFEVGSRRDDGPVRLDLSIPELIVGGVRRAHSVRRFVERLGSGHSVLEQTNSDAPPGLFADGESEFLELVDGRTPVKVLCQKGPGTEKENARSLYAFFCLDLVRIREAAGVRKLQWKTEGGALGEGK